MAWMSSRAPSRSSIAWTWLLIIDPGWHVEATASGRNTGHFQRLAYNYSPLQENTSEQNRCRRNR
jgi:hypothetical protein